MTPSEDLAAALAAQHARPVFDALSPSNRRQPLRFIDDARTPQSRAKGVARAVDHVLGRPRDRPRLNADRPLWTCPNCGNRFVKPSCATHTLATPFAGEPPRIRDVFASLREAVEACGPVKLVPYTTTACRSWCACGSPSPLPRPGGSRWASGSGTASSARCSTGSRPSRLTSTVTSPAYRARAGRRAGVAALRGVRRRPRRARLSPAGPR